MQLQLHRNPDLLDYDPLLSHPSFLTSKHFFSFLSKTHGFHLVLLSEKPEIENYLRLAATATAILKTPKRFFLTECNSETDQKNSFETKKNIFFYLHVYYAPPGPSGFKKISLELMFSN
jgi:hypothetical protein